LREIAADGSKVFQRQISSASLRLCGEIADDYFNNSTGKIVGLKTYTKMARSVTLGYLRSKVIFSLLKSFFMDRTLRTAIFITFFLSSISSSVFAQLLSINFGTTVQNTTGVAASSNWSTNAGATNACTTGDYVYYTTAAGYFYTNTFHVPRGKGVAISFSVKRPSGTGTLIVYARIGGGSTFNTTNRERNGWMQLATAVAPTTSCVTNTSFAIPGNICSGQDVSSRPSKTLTSIDFIGLYSKSSG